MTLMISRNVLQIEDVMEIFSAELSKSMKNVKLYDGTVEDVKPHPEPINICMSELGIEPHESCIIGDFHEDIDAARNANLAKAIAVDTPGEIINAIENLKI